MSFKDNYIKFSEKFGGTHALIGKGLSKSNVNSIMAGSMPLADTAYKVAKVLGVTVEELIKGEKKKIDMIAEEQGDYQYPKGQKCIDIVLDILKSEDKEAIQTMENSLEFWKSRLVKVKKNADVK